MTPEKTLQPFLLKFSQDIERPTMPAARYEETRCLVQYLIDGNWVDAPDASVASTITTLVTNVRSETTDDS